MVAVLRIYADDDGESHLEEVELAFEAEDFVPPAPPVLMTQFKPAVSYAFERVPPGWHGDWHPAPSRVLAVYLSGRRIPTLRQHETTQGVGAPSRKRSLIGVGQERTPRTRTSSIA
jgi:hypothetical protein